MWTDKLLARWGALHENTELMALLPFLYLAILREAVLAVGEVLSPVEFGALSHRRWLALVARPDNGRARVLPHS